MRLAASMNIRFPVIVPTPLTSLVPQAGEDGINVMRDMLHWEPRRRPTAIQVSFLITNTVVSFLENQKKIYNSTFEWLENYV